MLDQNCTPNSKQNSFLTNMKGGHSFELMSKLSHLSRRQKPRKNCGMIVTMINHGLCSCASVPAANFFHTRGSGGGSGLRWRGSWHEVPLNHWFFNPRFCVVPRDTFFVVSSPNQLIFSTDGGVPGCAGTFLLKPQSVVVVQGLRVVCDNGQDFFSCHGPLFALRHHSV